MTDRFEQILGAHGYGYMIKELKEKRMLDVVDGETGEIKYVLRSGALNVTAYDSDAVSVETGLVCDPKDDYAQQQFKDECDINEIVRRFGLTGQMPEDVRVPVSGDFTDVMDYESAMLAVRKADEAFMELPAEVRARFHNDPQELMVFVEDGRNLPEAEKLGLIAKKPEVTRDVVTAVDELSKKFDNVTVGSSTVKKE